jgi:hypothetical protein
MLAWFKRKLFEGTCDWCGHRVCPPTCIANINRNADELEAVARAKNRQYATEPQRLELGEATPADKVRCRR